MDAITPALSALLHRIAAHRATAARLVAEIETAQRRMHTLLDRRVPGDEIDAIEDAILELRSRLMAGDAAMMALVEQARRTNGQRPPPRRLDLDQAFRAMPARG
jgi:hypothetical protein